MFRLMAHALDHLTASVPAFVATYALVDSSPEAYVIGPCLIKVDGPDAPSPQRLYREYVASAESDPLIRFAVSSPGTQLVRMDYDSYRSSRFASAFRDQMGIGPRVRLLLRDETEPVAAIGLMRRAAEPDFDRSEANFLLASHEFLEAVHLIAIRRARAERRVDELARTFRFSFQEREIVRLILAGASNAQIAEQLTVTTATVRRQLRQLYTKLGVENRSELAALILEHRKA
jgi:DNA-binding CsgD family transcriptional regulator